MSDSHLTLPRLLMSTRYLTEWLWTNRALIDGDIVGAVLIKNCASAVVANGGTFTTFEVTGTVDTESIGIDHLVECLALLLDYIHEHNWDHLVLGDFGNGLGLHIRTLTAAGGSVSWGAPLRMG